MDHHKSIRQRTLIMIPGIVLFWCVLVGRLFTIQVLRSGDYQEICKKQSDYKKVIPPLRGTLYDRHRKPLTADIIRYNISAHPYLVRDKTTLAEYLSRCLESDKSRYLSCLGSDRTFVWLERNVPHTEIQNDLFTLQDRYSGLVIDRRVHRYYPLGEISGQLIGFTNIDNKGITGLELELDPYLSGLPGWRIGIKDGHGRPNHRPDLPEKNAVDGNHIFLTIDREYQIILFEELKAAYDRHRADKAMGIIIDPGNGEIMAMVSLPAFNPNQPAKYSVSAQKNCVITDIFEPGSTFKIVTATAAFESHSVQSSDSIDCTEGYVKIGQSVIHDHKKYNTLSFAEIIKNSSNVGTVKIAQKIGADLVFEYARRYGFGSRTDIEFPGEAMGIMHPLKDWTDLMLAQVSIGHGICCTALQLAYAYAAIANNGLLLKPQLVRRIETREGIPIYSAKPHVIRRTASEATMQKLRELLRLTVQSGTGLKANVHGMDIAGKTGTAQKVTETGYSQTDYIATFVGFFPVDNPKLLCVIVVDNPKGPEHTGGNVSAPVVKEVFKRIVNLSDELLFDTKYYNKPNRQYSERSEESAPNYTQPVATNDRHRIQLSTYQYSRQMPNLRGKTMRQAVAILQSMGLQVAIQGSGTVTTQHPKSGQFVTPNTLCTLTLSPRRIAVD